MKKKIGFILALLSLMTFVLVSINGFIKLNAKSSLEANSNMTYENGVYTSNAESAVVEFKNTDFSNYNTVEADFSIDRATSFDSQVSIQINDTQSYYLFQIKINGNESPDDLYANVSYGNTVLYEQKLDDSFKRNEFIHFKVVLKEGYYGFYLNDLLINQEFDALDFNYLRVLACTWRCIASVKNIELSTSTIPNEEDTPIIEKTELQNMTYENGIYTSTSSLAKATHIKDFKDINSVSATVNYKDTATLEGYLAIRLYISSKVNYRFSIYTNGPVGDKEDVHPPVAIIKKNDGNNICRVELDRKTYGANQTFKIQAFIESNYLAFYVDSTKVFETEEVESDVSLKRIVLESYKCPTTFKDVKYENIKRTHIDFEFSSKKAVESFEVLNGSLTYDEGKMVASLNGNIKVTSPIIDVSRGHRYSMYLPLRNTFLFRMANNTSSSKIRLTFTQRSSSRKYTKEFDILPNSDFNTYYFNVSDLNPSGYLEQFSIEVLNANTGSIIIDAITFEREERLYNYAGSITSCLVNKNSKTITIKGKLNPSYINKEVTLYQSELKNYSESLNYPDLIVLATTKATNNEFEFTIPLYKENSTNSHMSTAFLASVDNVKVSPHFYVSNYEDIYNPGQRFTVPNKEVNVLDYGAKGDGFTDDTQAFQKALDHLMNMGGGRLIIPGDDSTYGKRYILTHIEIHSNTEFVIEENAILWQSQRKAELDKTVPVRQRGFDECRYGHDVDVDGLVWCTTFSTIHLPMIFVSNCENVRITGGGTIRMNDAGGEEEDPFYFVGDSYLAVGQENRIQQIPLCIYSSKHIDVTNINFRRSNGWHFYNSFNNDEYIANINTQQAASITADGFTITSCKNVTLNRCLVYTSDDAVGICTAYEDGRGQFYRPTKPEEDNAEENIKVLHSYLFGGFGTSWMPWGTAASDAYKQETRNVEVGDCVLGGHKSVGTWPDDPFYGWSSTTHYTQTEDKDYCSIKDVYYHDNVYMKNFDLTLNNIHLMMTNLIVTDRDVEGTIYGSSEFLNATFDKIKRSGEYYKDESNFVVGLTYWSERPQENCTLGTEIVDAEYGYSAFIKGNGELFEGLYETAGNYTFKLDTMLKSGSAKIFARDAITGEIYASKEIKASEKFTNTALDFSLNKPTTVQLGVVHSGNENEIIYFDNAKLDYEVNKDLYNVTGDEIALENALTLKPYGNGNNLMNANNKKIEITADGEVKLISKVYPNLNEFKLEGDILASKDKEINCGFYVLAANATNEQDKIDSYNVQVEKQANSDKFTVKIFLFSNEKGYLGCVGTSKEYTLSSDKIHLSTVYKNNTLFVFVDNEEDVAISYYINKDKTGTVGLRSQIKGSTFANVKLTVKKEQEEVKPNLSDLNDFIAKVESLDLSKYDDESVNNLNIALKKAKEITDTNTQEEVDEALANLMKQYNNLKERVVDNNTKTGCRGSIMDLSLTGLLAILLIAQLYKKERKCI